MTTPNAYVVHRTRERVRLRIREKRNDAEYFDDVRHELAHLSDAVNVRVNPTTGSVLLSHPEYSFTELEALLADVESFVLIDGPEPEPSALESLSAGISRIDEAISESSGGSADLRTLMFIALMALALRQILRGNVMIPALGLLWTAFDLAAHSATKQSVSDGDSIDSSMESAVD